MNDKPESYYSLRRSEIARLILGKPYYILEIGCGSGHFKENLTWDCEYHGVEPFAKAAEKAAANGLVIHKGTYDQVNDELPQGRFDLVIANDVIEHMQDPWAFLESIKSKLSEHGTIIGSVPNVRYLTNLWNLLVRHDWQYTQSGVLDRTHLRFFTLRSFKSILTNSGFDIDIIKPSGPDKYALLKKFLYPFAFPIGTDVLYMQIAFRAQKLSSPANHHLI